METQEEAVVAAIEMMMIEEDNKAEAAVEAEVHPLKLLLFLLKHTIAAPGLRLKV